MSDGIDALSASQAVEAKLAEFGADGFRSFSETPESPAPDMGTPETPRNELGQFTSTEPADADQEFGDDPAETVPETVTDTPQGDPAVAAFLAKYGGDVNKALEGAVHLQRKAGTQSNELGELRQMVTELTSLQTQAIQAQTQPQQPVIDQATVDWYDQQIMENPQQALEWARQQNNPLLVQRGLSVWKDLDPYEAAVYTNRMENQAMQAQMQAQLQQQQQLPQDATVHLALQSVLNRNPQFTNYSDAIETTLSNHPFAARALEQATRTGDAQQIEGAIETLYHLAVGDTLQSLALTPNQADDTTTLQDVVTPTVSETREPAPPPTETDRFREAFRQEADRARKGVWVAD